MGPARENTVATHTTVLKSATVAAMEALITIMMEAPIRYIPGLNTPMISSTNVDVHFEAEFLCGSPKGDC